MGATRGQLRVQQEDVKACSSGLGHVQGILDCPDLPLNEAIQSVVVQGGCYMLHFVLLQILNDIIR